MVAVELDYEFVVVIETAGFDPLGFGLVVVPDERNEVLQALMTTRAVHTGAFNKEYFGGLGSSDMLDEPRSPECTVCVCAVSA